MRNDLKIKKLIIKYGIKGYGLYNLILESIAESLSSSKPVPELQETAADIALLYHDDTTQVEEIMRYMIENDLFEISEITGRILCNKIYGYIDKAQTRSKEVRNMITMYKKSYVSDSHKQIDTLQDKTDRIDKNRLEENRLDEDTKSDSKKLYQDHVYLEEDKHDKLVTDYGEEVVNAKIASLNAYIANGDSRYAYKQDHYSIIMAWLTNDVMAGKIKKLRPKCRDAPLPEIPEEERMTPEEVREIIGKAWRVK
jgi:hypothetical protein